MLLNVDEKLDEYLTDEIERVIEKSKNGEEVNVENFRKLYELRIKHEKDMSEEDCAFKKSNTELDIARIDEDTKKRERFTEILLKSLEIGTTLAFNSYWMYQGLHFEKEGSLHSPVFKTLWTKWSSKK